MTRVSFEVEIDNRPWLIQWPGPGHLVKVTRDAGFGPDAFLEDFGQSFQAKIWEEITRRLEQAVGEARINAKRQQQEEA